MRDSLEDRCSELRALVARYAANRDEYLNPSYGETSLRVEFLDPLFCILGWDVNNESGLSIYSREVIHEANVTVDDEDDAHANKKPDYAFRIGGETKFFLEAKKPSVNIMERRKPAFQARRYGWNGNHAIAVLSNFEDLSIYDCGYRPVETQEPGFARIAHYGYNELVDHFEELYNLVSKEAVATGSLDEIDAREQAARVPFDDLFLGQISSWRADISVDVCSHYTVTDMDALSQFTQTLLNRIIFLRVCEDRSFEDEEELLRIASYEELREAFASADAKYDSGLFDYLEDAPGGCPIAFSLVSFRICTIRTARMTSTSCSRTSSATYTKGSLASASMSRTVACGLRTLLRQSSRTASSRPLRRSPTPSWRMPFAACHSHAGWLTSAVAQATSSSPYTSSLQRRSSPGSWRTAMPMYSS